jgi:hypothetical protein
MGHRQSHSSIEHVWVPRSGRAAGSLTCVNPLQLHNEKAAGRLRSATPVTSVIYIQGGNGLGEMRNTYPMSNH